MCYTSYSSNNHVCSITIKIKNFSSFHVNLHSLCPEMPKTAYVHISMYAKDGAVKCCGLVSGDQDRVHESYTNDVRLNIEIFSITKTFELDSKHLINILRIYTCF